MFRHRDHDIPGLNMSSMPDLIFTVLFFFMIVTHMRSTPVKVQYQMPQGTELTRLTKKSAVTYIYIGKPIGTNDSVVRIQLNDKFADAGSIPAYIIKERGRMSAEDAQAMTVSLKADRHTDMGTITDVKQALRQAKAYRVNYSAEKR
jgi:biopolymer transport protein ExbD